MMRNLLQSDWPSSEAKFLPDPLVSYDPLNKNEMITF